LVKKVASGETTVYPSTSLRTGMGNLYEKDVAGGQVRKYYYFNPLPGTGGQRVALQKEGVLQYVLGDHLGSTSLVLNGDGTVHSEARYYPYGAARWSSGTLPTEYRFTGQREESGLGLYQMGARWYDAALGRWISADTIVPEPGNPQAFNRYSWVLGNPLKFSDPSGHMEIYGGSYEPYSDYWYTYVNPNAAGCQASQEHIAQVGSLAVDFTPGVGDAKGFAEVFTGRDLITGESLGAWRFLGLVGLSEVRHLRYADEILEMGVATGRVLRGGEWVELGRWASRSVSMNDAARMYQQYVTGAEAGYEFLRNGVYFDGIRMTDAGEAVLLDAKAGADFYSKVGHEPFVKNAVLTEAQRQLGAANGLMIQWHIQDYATWEALRDLFRQQEIMIEVKWTPGP
jgi:RHS repeat-associated protein